MRVVIVGAKGRESETDKALAWELVRKCAIRYHNPVFITMVTSRGIGSFVKEICLEKNSSDRYQHQLIEVMLKTYIDDFSKTEQTSIYTARNATPFELGDIFYYFAQPDRRGPMEDLIKRAETGGRPLKIFLPGDKIELV